MNPSPARKNIIDRNDKDVDPNIPQRAAADPLDSVWVAASAGSGKTKVLTDRVLRLLLPRTDGTSGTPPEKILCLTYTKAGASEMALRISQILSLWATMPLNAPDGQKSLVSEIRKLTGREELSDIDINAARRLFARVVDAPGGLKIMTIHAFCQSVLGRFPLEAGLPPHFTVLTDDQARSLLLQARDSVLKNAGKSPQGDLNESLGRLAAALSEGDFADLMQKLCSERQSLSDLLKSWQGSEGLWQEIRRHLGIAPDETEDTIRRGACEDRAFPAEALRRAIRALEGGISVNDKKLALAMVTWLEADTGRRIPLLSRYTDSFLTPDKETKMMRPRSVLATAAAEKEMPGIKALLTEEAERVLAVRNRLATLENARSTRDLLRVGEAIIGRYQDLKHRQAGLDFDDMINKTRDLLRGDGLAAWVLYKLDGGLDHILVDEAQDTNPEQWDIVESLIGEFFSGRGARDTRRTLFVVGDEKQSIYSFQRAAPDRFHQKRDHFRRIVENAGEIWKEIPLDVSFRSASAVLRFTDAVFEAERARRGVSATAIRHASFRKGHAGHIEQWPLFRAAETNDESGGESRWLPVLQPRVQNNARALLARHIAETIEQWVGREVLPSRGRPIQPGDIMILVRNRNAIVGHILRELKSRGIPVNGLDRMKLGDHIAVQDMMALARFSLLPEDDLSLACVLKSPLINWNDQRLEEVAAGRKGSLWEAVRVHAAAESAWLRAQISHARHMRPYEFFSQILQTPCPASTISGLHAMTARLGEDVIDPLDEFLNLVLSFEGDHVSTVQGFTLWQEKSETEIKREQDDSSGRVRIMTVHASKGLQAPIVILPDTLKQKGSGNHAANRLLWPGKTALPFPFWSPHSEDDCGDYRQARDRARDRDQEEYRRLLYVALTRAEDRLYIGGAAGKNAHDPGSWYELTKDAFGLFDEAQTSPFAASSAILNALDHGDDPAAFTTLAFTTPQSVAPEDKKKRDAGPALRLPDLNDPAWAWVREEPDGEPLPPRPLIPSQVTQYAEQEPAALSPLLADDGYRFRRGHLTHRLLQFLPDLEDADRATAAQNFVERYGHDLPATIRAGVAAETMKVLTHPDFSALFGPASRAEVPVTGLVKGKLVSGQIDRLLVTESHVHIVDYKTNRPPPQDESAVPAAYRAQLEAYRDTLAMIYPHHVLKTWLLWTEGPRLMEISL